MASRNTYSEAQEVKKEIEKRHQDAKIVIIENSATRRIGRAVAEEKGFEIVEDNGGIMVTVNEMRFDILEARTCGDCGKEYTTAAIGEADNQQCQACQDKSSQTWQKELEIRKAKKVERAQELDWRNDFEEVNS